jgi:TonB family protein
MVSFAMISPAQSPQTPPTSNSPAANDSDNHKTEKSKSPLPSCYYAPLPPGTVESMKAKFIGTVRVEATFTVEGKIENIRIMKSPGLGLDESIVQAVKKWKCRPAIGPDGKPIQVTVPLSFKFNIY